MYPVHPEWQPETMLETSWSFITVGPQLDRATGPARAAAARELGSAPTIERAIADARRLFRQVALISRAIHEVGDKLRIDAETEQQNRHLNELIRLREQQGCERNELRPGGPRWEAGGR